MAKLKWDQATERIFETGVQQGVLYVQDNLGAYPTGVAWNGLIGVTESPSGAEATPQYADNTIYLNLISAETFEATIEAFTYPDAFAQCDGSATLVEGVMVGQQARKPFGLAYKTVLGNDAEGIDYGYKLHLIYGALAAPSEKAYKTISDSPEANTFSWAIKTTPVTVTGFRPTSQVTIDSTKYPEAKMVALEKLLFGDTSTTASLPLPDAIAAILGA